MTIETRMSYPEEGGSECPPEESPVPGSPSSMATSSEERLGHTCAVSTCQDTVSSSSSSSGANSSNQSNKVKVVPGQQRSKDRSLKKLPPPIVEGQPNEQSSEEISNNVNNNSTEKDDQCTKCTMSLAGNVKAEDLKKPSKGRSSPSEAGEGSNKEEAASRKSMRLRLKRRNPADGPFVSQKLPRYVEDLIEVDFTDEKQKVQFMHVLGMSRAADKAKMESQYSPVSIVTSGPEKASEEKVTGARISPVLVKCDTGTEAEPKIAKPEFNKKDKMRELERLDPSLSMELNRQPKSKLRDENSGWENWVIQLLLRGKGKSETRSPTTREINDSVARLRAIGTSVKIVK